MTRWARGGNANKKHEQSASSWSQLNETIPKDVQRSKTRNRVYEETKKVETSINKHKRFKKKRKLKKRKGLLSTLVAESEERPINNSSGEEDEEKPQGLAAELEQLKSISEENELNRLLKKEKKREERRLQRMEDRQNDITCYNCRKKGHDMSNCPEIVNDTSQGTGICFKCGSTEHSLNRCPVRMPKGVFPYAKCFICGETGHLSKQCPDNPRGLYPNGGCCKHCGSVEHYKRDCTELKKKQGIEDLRLSILEKGSQKSADEESTLFMTAKPPLINDKKPVKIVKF